MGDLSQFMKLLKQRFTRWFNQTHGRVGTLWSERYKSALVDHRSNVLRVVAAYIDLNAVRAGMVRDPKDYRFGGYAAAVAGEELARRGIMKVLGLTNWEESQAEYRLLLYGSGTEAREHKAAINEDDFQRVMRAGGKLPLDVVLRHRIRHFTDGAVLGSRVFVAEQLARYHQRTGRRRASEPQPLPPVTDWGDIAVMRRPRGNPIG
jgi:hypothetical protein